MVASTLANVHRNSKKHPKPFSPSDFIPQWGAVPASARLDPKELRIKMYAAFGDRIVQKPKAA